MTPEEHFERILTLLHEAALDEVHWLEAARLISEVTQTKSSFLVFSERRLYSEVETFFARSTIDGQRRKDIERRYFRDYFLGDEGVPSFKRQPDGQLVHTRDRYTDTEKKTSKTYNGILRDYHCQNGLTVRLNGPGGSQIGWEIGDSTARGGWGSAQLRVISDLLPHVRQFVRVRRALADAEALGSSLADLLDNHRFGVIQLDRQGRIVEANDWAKGLLRKGDGLFDRDGCLVARMKADNTELQRLLARALAPFGIKASAGSMTVRQRAKRTRLAVHVNPVAERPWDNRSRSVAALVLVADAESSARIDPGIVAAALGLTPSESRLAVMLAAGYSVRTIAARTRRTEGTVRWHLNQIYRKRRISRQADLVRLVLSLDGFPGSER